MSVGEGKNKGRELLRPHNIFSFVHGSLFEILEYGFDLLGAALALA